MIYLDNNATTPLDPAVLESMLPYFKQYFGNAASHSHALGWQAKAAVDHARKQIAEALCATAEEIIFTSGATESNNLAVLGYARANRDFGRHLITVATEHKAILDPCQQLEQEGFEVTYLPVNSAGLIDLKELQAAIRTETILISIMAANNEIGTLQALASIGKIAKTHHICFHSDAAQAFGKISLDLQKTNIDMLSLSGHKIYGPKGVGVLYIRQKKPKLQLQPLLFGGGHERGLRSGTLHVPEIVGFGKAAEIAMERFEKDQQHLENVRKTFLSTLQKEIPELEINSPLENRLCNNLNLSFPGVSGEALMMELRDLAISSGSACSSASPEPSHVLKALGFSKKRIKSSIRFGFGRFNTEAEILKATDLIIKAIDKLKS